MFIELHILQNFAPSNLNRDDSNAPKDCYFGGFRRARISSQCIKRSIRTSDFFKKCISAAKGDEGVRTKRIISEVAEQLVKMQRDPALSKIAADNTLKCLGLMKDDNDNNKSEYLLYLGKEEIKRMVEVINNDENWKVISEVKPLPDDWESLDKKKKKAALKKLFPKELQNSISKVISSDRQNARSYAADIALFGRMLADDKNMNVDAACQVAHAISTNEVEMKMDFFTAVDDLLREEESGSDMMGMVEYNSSCFYRYAQINMDILKKNFGFGKDQKAAQQMVNATVVGFLKAAVQAVPTGMQNSTAAHNQPSYIRAVLRSKGAPWSLANAFIQPVKPGRKEGEDLIAKSALKLEEYFEGLKIFYGDEAGIETDKIASHNLNLPKRNDFNFPNLISEIGKVLSSVGDRQ
jgi:CRISPR system Cascade subunit CasC